MSLGPSAASPQLSDLHKFASRLLLTALCFHSLIIGLHSVEGGTAQKAPGR